MSPRVLSISAATSVGLLLACPGLAQSAHAATARPRIVTIRVSPAGMLPFSGARVTVSVKVRNATRCAFLRQRAPGSPLRVFRTRSCASGRARVTFPAVRNRSHSVVRLTYAVKAIEAGLPITERRVVRREAGTPSSPQPPPSPTASLTITPQTLPYTGGTVSMRYSSSSATSCALSVKPSGLWSGNNPLAVSCNGTTTLNGVLATISAQQWTITFTATSAAGRVATATGTLNQQGKTVLSSSNWSGYVLPSTNLVTEVSGTFTVPTLNCSQTPSAGESTWVGIGGAGGSTGDLLQTGVRSDCVAGVQADDPAWWEEYPEVAEADFNGMAVSPGDQIKATVYKATSGTAWETCVDDVSTGVSGLMVTGEGWGVTTGGCTGTFTLQGSTASLSYAGGYTAEWIVEDYASGSSLVPVPFADYGTVTFTSLTTSLSSWNLTSANPVEIVQNNSVLSVPSPPSGGGFSVSYTG